MTVEEMIASDDGMREAESLVDRFYAIARLRVGTSVTDGQRRGVIVKRGGQQWTTRERLPLVRWDGTIPAVKANWRSLEVSA